MAQYEWPIYLGFKDEANNLAQRATRKGARLHALQAVHMDQQWDLAAKMPINDPHAAAAPMHRSCRGHSPLT
jgi:hypothetical protein